MPEDDIPCLDVGLECHVVERRDDLRRRRHQFFVGIRRVALMREVEIPRNEDDERECAGDDAEQFAGFGMHAEELRNPYFFCFHMSVWCCQKTKVYCMLYYIFLAICQGIFQASIEAWKRGRYSENQIKKQREVSPAVSMLLHRAFAAPYICCTTSLFPPTILLPIRQPLLFEKPENDDVPVATATKVLFNEPTLDLVSAMETVGQASFIEAIDPRGYLAEVKRIECIVEEDHFGIGAIPPAPAILLANERSSRRCAILPVDIVNAHRADRSTFDFHHEDDVLAQLLRQTLHPLALTLKLRRVDDGQKLSDLGVVDPALQRRRILHRERPQRHFFPLKEYDVVFVGTRTDTCCLCFHKYFCLCVLFSMNQYPEIIRGLSEGTENKNPDFHSVGMCLNKRRECY